MEYLEKKSVHRNSIFDSIKKEITFELDSSNLIIDISHNVINILGFLSDEMIGRNIFDFIEVKESYFNLNFLDNIDMFFIHKNRGLVYMELQIKVIEDDRGKILRKYGSMIDISKYKEIERRKEHFKVVLESAKDIIYRFEIIPEPKFVYISSAVEEVFGYEVEEYYKNYMHVFNTSHPDDISILYKKMNNELDYSKPIESRWIHKSGNCVWIEDYVTPVYDNSGKLIAFEGVCRDISYRKALEENLSYLTYHDSLTGLKNRAFYDKQIEELNTLSNLPVGVIVCDLDNLKVINDTMGHNKGDSIIKSVSDLLLGIENNHIFISRIGGDEFVILVKNTSEFEIEELGRNINLLIKKHNSKNRECPIQLSIGYAFADRSVGKMEEIFKIADKNMYANKLHKNKRDRNAIEVTYNYTTIAIE
ncbi:sensor domain-containing diguanylate cyclase [Clostridium magnum]|uniref:Putative diguanylate cyclase YegE n=1 Tax=Clostridium magnum DSM 2767 TaxID=1121326 RepID=A0A162TD02_9CLOT|nr:diguanylate cyclase [Clostridium magnum]KZL92487.1 putative diguanylate cyclase YegE [Clostridium magnum DSM 2767]SHI26381.1 PAS domain S-box-containing protein/diguanylate cyclase (GGDEF) domain-containing protein [Clostridium magnum DSM 2767]